MVWWWPWRCQSKYEAILADLAILDLHLAGLRAQLNERLSVLATSTELTLAFDALGAKLEFLTRKETDMSAEVDNLRASVAHISQVGDSAMALINGLAEQLRNIATDPAAITALADELNAKADAIAADVVANTPAAPTP